ncbi:MAG: hypothetical protein ABW174_05710 [Flavitalea sp.]
MMFHLFDATVDLESNTLSLLRFYYQRDVDLVRVYWRTELIISLTNSIADSTWRDEYGLVSRHSTRLGKIIDEWFSLNKHPVPVVMNRFSVIRTN